MMWKGNKRQSKTKPETKAIACPSWGLCLPRNWPQWPPQIPGTGQGEVALYELPEAGGASSLTPPLATASPGSWHAAWRSHDLSHHTAANTGVCLALAPPQHTTLKAFPATSLDPSTGQELNKNRADSKLPPEGLQGKPGSMPTWPDRGPFLLHQAAWGATRNETVRQSYNVRTKKCIWLFFSS